MKSTSVISLNAVANPVVMAIPYLYCLIAAIYFERASLPLVIVGGAFLGLGSAGFYMLWQRLFASFDSDRGNLDLIRGTVYGAIMYFGLYRVAFPFVIASFLLLPFSSLEYARWQAAILYAVYSVVIMLMMIQCAQASRDRGINPVFIYGFFGGIVYTLHDVGFLQVPSPNRSVFGASTPWRRPRSCRCTFWSSCSSSAKAASSESFDTTRPLRTSSLSCSMAALPRA